ncbi:hypothetical protein [Denitromonas sp.]|uniref:hypothetical protein n=1 Tax=Denitromonas sp. TaxID=2734609 RepID=UPI002AFE576E|nr:hypothetical protein [Denitromonas sp.]
MAAEFNRLGAALARASRASLAVIALGVSLSAGWAIAALTESDTVGTVVRCTLKVRAGFSAPSLPPEGDDVDTECVVALAGDTRQTVIYVAPERARPLPAPGTRLPVRGSAFGQLAYRAPGQPRDTGLLQAGLVLVLVGVVIAMARRPKAGV